MIHKGLVKASVVNPITVGKESKKAKIRNRYNQVPHLTLDTTWESDKNTTKHHTQESQEVSPFPAGNHMATMNRQETLLSSLIARRRVGPQILWRFRLKDLSIAERGRAWCCVCSLAHRDLTIGFTLLLYSVVYTVESLSLFYLLLYLDLYLLRDDISIC